MKTVKLSKTISSNITSSLRKEVKRVKDSQIRSNTLRTIKIPANVALALKLKTVSASRFKVGDEVIMTDDAIDNYGRKYKGIVFIITDVATSTREHHGYDRSMKGMGLYELKFKKSGKDFDNSLYAYELKRA